MDDSEEARLRELRHFRILDTPPDRSFDDLVEVAALICQVPTALVSLVDEKRQWFKARRGLDACESPRETSFCTHAIAGKQLMVVPDATADPRFSGNPFVVGEPKVRAYAGAPLITRAGSAIGTLCVIDTVPRAFSREQKHALQLLSRQVVDQIERQYAQNSIVASLEAYQARATELKAAHTRLSSLIDHLEFGILAEDSQRRVLFVNQTFCTAFKIPISPDGLVGSAVEDLLPYVQGAFAEPHLFLSHTQEILAAGRSFHERMPELRDGRILERDYLPVYVDGLYDGHLWVYRDVTERTEAEKLIEFQKLKIANSAKLAALGEMASGVAHEINSPLAVILADASLLRREAGTGKLAPARVDELGGRIESVVGRIVKIVRGLTQFARDGEHDPLCEASVVEIVRDTLAFCRERIRHAGIRLEFAEPSSVADARCRPVQVSQALLNLLNNAYDVLAEVGEKWIRIECDSYDGVVCIRVTDSGPGISDEARSRLFGPFFTTKQAGQGIGLGLSISRSLIEAQEGGLYLDASRANTCFVIELPQSSSSLNPQV